MIELFIWMVGLLFFLGLGLFVGRATERRHFHSIERREQELSEMLVTQLKTFPQGMPGNTPPLMMIGEVVIATDYLKSFFAKFRNIFGGEIKSYQTMLVRARREALLRILEQARGQGYNAVCNVRYYPADVGGNSTTRKVAMVAILACATAYYAKPTAT